MVKTIDLNFQEQPGAIAAFLVPTDEGPVLIETGPHSTLPTLVHQLNEHGYSLADVKHVFITHIHLDHAGAAWAFAEQGAKIYLHPLGLPHLQNPEKLLTSAKRIYADKMDSLWGDLRPILASRLQAVDDNQRVMIGGVPFRARHTPGHAIHHIAWEMKDVAFTGDVAGIRIGENGPAMPPCPPPDINIEEWSKSLAVLRNRRYRAIYLTHFGELVKPKAHLIELEGRLHNWANWIKPYWEKSAPMDEVVPLFKAYVRSSMDAMQLSDEDIGRYELANPSDMSVAGLYRYWSKRGQ
ncbi:MAG: MBL fold metallo-hydrolase [Saprospiraceae bacterium]|jgi:glyoxylase-like metal-dependent hydrolase (beta-lactamase superfamily II)|nr:MBL fold metallo-hydrolase [Saprospiraceae bacterium]